MIEDNELLSDFIEESKENLSMAEEDFLSLENLVVGLNFGSF